jgi:hypothetical protein
MTASEWMPRSSSGTFGLEAGLDVLGQQLDGLFASCASAVSD